MTTTIPQTAIEQTASTIENLALATQLPQAMAIYDGCKAKGVMTDSFCADLSWLIKSRHETSASMLSKLSGEYQLIELGAGFSPHGVIHASDFAKYIEVDLPVNSATKKDIISQLYPDTTINYVSGDIYQSQTWKEIHSLLDQTKPICVFCEGVVNHYASDEEKDFLADAFLSLNPTKESILYLDDTFKHHAEFQTEPELQDMFKMLQGNLTKTSYDLKQCSTLADEVLQWKQRGFSHELIPYQLQNSPYDPILTQMNGLQLRV